MPYPNDPTAIWSAAYVWGIAGTWLLVFCLCSVSILRNAITLLGPALGSMLGAMVSVGIAGPLAALTALFWPLTLLSLAAYWSQSMRRRPIVLEPAHGRRIYPQ